MNPELTSSRRKKFDMASRPGFAAEPHRARSRCRIVALAFLAMATPLMPSQSVAAAPARFDDPIAQIASGALILAPTTNPSFVAWRHEVADEVGARLNIDPGLLDAAWARADEDHQIALMAALSQLGAPYRRQSADPDKGFDCSGLTSWAWSRAGFDLPRNSTRQMYAGEPRDMFSAQAGDLLRYPGHVMMWLGVGRAIVHSPQSGDVVRVALLSEKALERSRFFDPSV